MVLLYSCSALLTATAVRGHGTRGHGTSMQNTMGTQRHCTPLCAVDRRLAFADNTVAVLLLACYCLILQSGLLQGVLALCVRPAVGACWRSYTCLQGAWVGMYEDCNQPVSGAI
jgi:hypothetical protein